MNKFISIILTLITSACTTSYDISNVSFFKNNKYDVPPPPSLEYMIRKQGYQPNELKTPPSRKILDMSPIINGKNILKERRQQILD